jgi:hypothetical protein
MGETVQFGLPLVQAAQAQKHVTVNEALARLDALAQITLESRSVTVPPAVSDEGRAWAVPGGAVNAWAGQGGRIAIFANGGWVFVPVRVGWRGWIVDEHLGATFDGDAWRAGALAIGETGAAAMFRVVEFEHAVGVGATSQTLVEVPANVMLFAVTARVTEDITGTATSWQLGAPGSADRFGSGLGLGFGSFARGLLGSPMAYYAAEPLLLTAQGGSFAGGRVRLALHYFEASLPGV